VRPGDDAAVLALREAAGDPPGAAEPPVPGVAISSGASPNWTTAAPYDGARAVALENATNLAAVGASPLAAVDCLNGGNPEKPEVYDGFANVVEGLADMCQTLSVPVVGGNVSLYNDSATGAIPPTPTLAMVGTTDDASAPGTALAGEGSLVLVGERPSEFGGSEYLAQFGGSDRFPALPDDPGAVVAAVADVASQDATRAVHDVSDGGLAATLAEMVTEDAGAEVDVADPATLFAEGVGRVVVETTDVDAVRAAVGDAAPVAELGAATADGTLALSVGDETLRYGAEEIAALRDVLAAELD
jgi:phosphoribosylformylglycinamidine synthase